MPSFPVQPKRVVVKLGTGILTSGIGEIDTDRIDQICGQINDLRAAGTQVVLVSSGAVGLGMGRLGLRRRPASLDQLQACAAVGQSILIQLWQKGFERFSTTVAQLLLTHDDLRSRPRHLAAKKTFERLLSDEVVPIVNENDSVSAEEIRFGDNDVLSAMLASLVAADFLFILSTAPGLVDMRGSGEIVPVVRKITPEIEEMAGGTESATAVGGMVTKIKAAGIANRSGCGVFIASGSRPGIVLDLLGGRADGTFFVPSGLPLKAKKRWLAFFEKPRGNIHVDAGACRALTREGSSLLAVGISEVEGDFETGEVVNLLSPQKEVFARGISLYPGKEIRMMIGKSGADIRDLYPQRKHREVIHRDAFVLLE